MASTTLVLGGGVGGLVVARRLRRALPHSHRIVLVERRASFLFEPSLLWLMTGDRTVGAQPFSYQAAARARQKVSQAPMLR